MSVNSDSSDFVIDINDLRLRNIDKVLIGNINANSIRNKFEQLRELILKYVDVLIITETKLDDTFPSAQFIIEGFSEPFRRDRNRNGGGVMIYVRHDIPCRLLTKHKFASDMEILFLELNFRKCKWLLCGTYRPPSQLKDYYFNNLDKAIDTYSEYEKILLVGDFNTEESENCMASFLFHHNLKSIVKENTCFKNPNNPRSIDLMLTNNNLSFQHTSTYFTGISDFHKLVVSVLKISFTKNEPKNIYYRDYKHFNLLDFQNDLKDTFSNNKIDSCLNFTNFFLNTLNVHAPLKSKLIRANNSPYITKSLRKAIMKRSALETQYFKKQTENSLRAYKKQKNYCSRLYKKERKAFFENLNPSIVRDNKSFWKNVKPLFSNKGNNTTNIKLVENDEIIKDNDKVAEELNSFFKNAVDSLNIEENSYLIDKRYIDIIDPIDQAVVKYSLHPSILVIKDRIKINDTFSFESVGISDVENELKNINPNKATTNNNIPPKILKQSSTVSSPVLHKLLNESFVSCIFPEDLKLADITPVFKKKDPLEKSNYRPISVLPVLSKLFEKFIQKQMCEYMEPYLSPYLCGFRKGYNSQQALLSLIEIWKIFLDNKGFGSAIFMDLSKAFDTLNHDLLIAKLEAYGFQKNSLRFLHSYLKNRWQRTKVNTSFSSWAQLLQGVPQGSVLGPLLFDIYLNDLFLVAESTEVCNFADDTTFYACDKNLSSLIQRLEHDSYLAIEWFENNYMKLNQDKCHLLVPGHKYENIFANIGQSLIWESPKEKLLRFDIDKDLKFNEYVLSLCKKAGQKLSVLKRICNYMNFKQRKILMKSFIEAQFGYCPLIWMFCGRTENNKINHIHERSLRIVYKDYSSSFNDLLKKAETFTIHHRNIQSLAIELFKVKNEISNPIIADIFDIRHVSYNLRSQVYFPVDHINTSQYGLSSIRFYGSKVWNMIPSELRDISNLEIFKKKIRQWEPIGCNCKLCQTYINNLGYVTVE